MNLRPKGLSLLLLLLALPLAIAQTQPPPAPATLRVTTAPDPRAELKKKWEEVLRPVLKDVPYAMILDLPAEVRPELPVLKSAIGPMESWRRYAVLNERDLLVTKNGLALHQRERSLQGTFWQLAREFAKMPVGQLRSIAINGAEITELPGPIQRIFVENWGLYPGISERYLRGDPVFIRLIEMPSSNVVNGERGPMIGDFRGKIPAAEGYVPRPVPQKATPIATQEGFFLGDGRAVTVGELAFRIRRELGARLHYDSRFRDCLLYVQGYLPKDQVIQVMKKLLEAQPVIVEENQPLTLAEFEGILKAIEGTTDLKDWRGHNLTSWDEVKSSREYTLEEMFELVPTYKTFVNQPIIGGEKPKPDWKFTLELSLAFRIKTEPIFEPGRPFMQSDGLFVVPRPKPPAKP
ncbi:MAG TPA: hypothetical protein PLO61_01015 [Fimbriimonadaceae bacterium]|nr:hypothetical protein [Fimbriimonadaceae bacterium]HRJ32479.1 hypothetical protein [Fimbriimonadaceae bacterium]